MKINQIKRSLDKINIYSYLVDSLAWDDITFYQQVAAINSNKYINYINFKNVNVNKQQTREHCVHAQSHFHK